MRSATLNIGFFRLMGMLAKGALLQYFLSLRKCAFGGLRSRFAQAHRKLALLIADVIQSPLFRVKINNLKTKTQ